MAQHQRGADGVQRELVHHRVAADGFDRLLRRGTVYLKRAGGDQHHVERPAHSGDVAIHACLVGDVEPVHRP